MKNTLQDIARGKFLVSDGSFGNWAFIFYCTFLAIVMIGSSHRADRKVMEIAAINYEVKKLRSEFVDTRKKVMQERMESNIAKEMKWRGIYTSDMPPQKIIVQTNK
ncbi:MAG: S-adenosyl-methyltransferase [Flavobacteriaceae bacterium]|nr:S-adenosyl-methyltransferase [Flavobacteriaceae bacterium]